MLKKISLLSSFIFLLFYISCLHYTPQHKISVEKDKMTGVIKLSQKKGFSLSAPWVLVTKIDTRPQRVCISSTSKTLHCKLVQFVPKYYEVFVKREGFSYYWWANRLSFNIGYDEHYRGLQDKLRGYAFSKGSYSFIKILESYHE